MTQKASLFKGQKKKKTIPANRHGKVPQTRKGTLFRCLSLFLNYLEEP